MGILGAVGGIAGAFFGGPAGAAAGSGIGGGLDSIFSASSAESHAEQNAREQMNFQDKMRQTQYQTAVTDMKAAGLNPMLAYSQGGSGTPSGANAPAAVRDPRAGGFDLATAAQVENTKASTDLLQAQAENVRAQTPGAVQEVRLKTTSADQAEFMRGTWKYEFDMANTRMRNLRYENEKLKARNASQDELAANERAISEAEVRRAKAVAALEEFDVPGARNKAASDETPYGRNVRPYLRDAADVSHSAGSLHRFFH